jgi:hypothetical protein
MVDVGRRVQREKDEKLAQQKLDMGMAVSQEMAQEDE